MSITTQTTVSISTPTSTEQTSTADDTTTSLPCSTRSIEALPIAFSSINSDSCLGEPSAICNNGSGTDNVPSYCECAENGIWTIIQRRFDGSVNFYRNWTDYKEGFGDLTCEYWLGNDAIHQITSRANYTLKIYLTDWDNVTVYAKYDVFRIAAEANGYRLTIGGYSGDAGDSLTNSILGSHNGYMFSTKDRDNDGLANFALAEYFSGAWWYGGPSTSSLNGKYHFGPIVSMSFSNGYGIWWDEYSPYRYSIKETKMLIKAK